MMGRRHTPDLLPSTLLAYPFNAEPFRPRKKLARKSSKKEPEGDGQGASKENAGEGALFGAPSRTKSAHHSVRERRSKNILFYRNGDKFYKGKKVRITPHRYLTFNELLNDLTKSVSLPYGVRRIYTPEGQVIANIDDLEDGKAYVCASFERFKQLKYGTTSLPDWTSNIKKPSGIESKYPVGRLSLGYSYPPTGKYAASYSKATGRTGRSVPGPYHGQKAGQGEAITRTLGRHSDVNAYRPRLVKFVKYGEKPRKTISILLNKRTMFSFEHLLNEITVAFDLSTHKNQKVRKLYTTKGKEIRGISDFFRETDSVFIAATSRQPLLKVEIADILEEIFPAKPPPNLPHETRRKFRDKDSKSDSGVEIDVPDDTPTKSASADLPPLKSQRHQKDKIVDSEKFKAKAWASPKERKADEKRIIAEEKRRKEEVARRKKEEAERKANEDERKRKEEELRKQEEEKERKKREEDLQAELARKEAELKEKEEELRRKEEESKRKEDEIKREEEERERKEKMKKDEEKRKREEKRKQEDKLREAKKEKIKEEEKKKTAEQKKEEEKRSKEEKKRKEEQKKEEEKRKKEEELKKKEEEKLKNEQREKARLEELKKEEEKKKEEENSKMKDSIDALTVKESKGRPDDEDGSKVDIPAEDSSALTIKSEHNSDMKPEETNHNHVESNEVDTKVTENTTSDPPADKKAENRFAPAPREIVDKNVILEKYEVGIKIGDGNFAEVHKAIQKKSNEVFAMKIVYKSKLKGKEHMIANEIGIMHNINHKNIVRLYEEYETKNHIYLLMEYVSGGDLFDAITESVKFTEADGAQIVGDMARALGYLHDLNIVHRDLKPENLLVSKSSSGDIMVKLADFGLAMEVMEPIYTVCGTPTYVAPEILAETGYGLEVDMWATGVITYILLCGFPPFRSPDRDQEELFELIQAGSFEYLSPYWDNISFDAKDLINHLLVVLPKRRFKAEQVLRHPWIVNHNKSADLPNLQREVSMNLEMNFEGRKSAKSRVADAEY